MQISEQGMALIRQFEGFSARAYLCPAGKWTIGYGHVIREGEDFEGVCMTSEQAESLLEQDVNACAQQVFGCLKITPTQGQFDAMVSLAYNIGLGAFVKSTLVRFFNAGNRDAAAGQFSRWAYINGQKSAGLLNRRAAEAALFIK